MSDVKISIITPTTGKDSLFNLIETITRQKVPVNHILLWDDKREDAFADKGNDAIYALDKKEYLEMYQYSIENIILKGNRTNGIATGSALRSIGLMAANTEFITFADDDTMMEDGHLFTMMQPLVEENKNWTICKRKIWTKIPSEQGPQYELIGIDEFESVGEDAKTPYKMVDNNCMMFKRKFGVSAACLYREVKEYCDDRLFYQFLMKYAGEPGKTGFATVNQVCPDRLVEFFRKNCTKVLA